MKTLENGKSDGLIFIGLRTAIFDDTRIKYIESLPDADALLVIWIKLLCLAGKCDREGEIIVAPNVPMNDATLIQQFNRPLNVIRAALAEFIKLGMVALVEGRGLKIVEWEREHYVAGLQRAKEQARLRQQKRRAKPKLLPSAPADRESAPSPDPFAGCIPETVEKWSPAFDALTATGKLPALMIEHLALVDREHLHARLVENYGEIVTEAKGVTGTVGATLPWLRKAVSSLERRAEQRNADRAANTTEDKF